MFFVAVLNAINHPEMRNNNLKRKVRKKRNFFILFYFIFQNGADRRQPQDINCRIEHLFSLILFASLS
jgi:hypothetical protein